MSRLLQELQRRNVIRVSVAYMAMAWLILQIADTVLPAFDVAPWVLRALIIALVLGLPTAIAAAWIFEWTPQGVIRTDDIPEGVSYTRQTGRKIDFVIIALLSLALLTVVVDQYILKRDLSPPISTIAVLPLANLSGDSADEYFVDGMTEALITSFANINSLRVISRTSIMRFKNTERSLPAIAAELGADAIVTGAVVRQGENLRITVQLIDAETDTSMWGESFEGSFADVFAVQSKIARAITDRIKVDVSPQELEQLARIAESSTDGYDDYLKGMQRFYRLTPEDLQVAIEHFDRSLELNPRSALAHSGIAAAWIGLRQMGFATADIAGTNSEAAAIRALEIDPELAEAYAWLAIVRAWGDFNWKRAEELFLKSIELNPNYADARGAYGHLLAVKGRFEESEEQLLIAQQLDPLNGWIMGQRGVVFHMQQRYDVSIPVLEEALRISPKLPFVWLVLAGSYHYEGRHEDAINAEASYLAALGMTAARDELLRQFEDEGYDAAMLWMADLMAEQSLSSGAQGMWTAFRYAHASDDEKVITWLQRAYEQRDPNIAFLRLPEFADLHTDPRVQEIINKVDVR